MPSSRLPTSPDFKKIYDSQVRPSRRNAYLWMQLSEYSFDTFMMIQQRNGKL
jgi:TRAP-type mannitol/chloroaromatic compound transport system substrate-binding protein